MDKQRGFLEDTPLMKYSIKNYDSLPSSSTSNATLSPFSIYRDDAKMHVKFCDDNKVEDPKRTINEENLSMLPRQNVSLFNQKFERQYSGASIAAPLADKTNSTHIKSNIGIEEKKKPRIRFISTELSEESEPGSPVLPERMRYNLAQERDEEESNESEIDFSGFRYIRPVPEKQLLASEKYPPVKKATKLSDPTKNSDGFSYYEKHKLVLENEISMLRKQLGIILNDLVFL